MDCRSSQPADAGSDGGLPESFQGMGRRRAPRYGKRSVKVKLHRINGNGKLFYGTASNVWGAGGRPHMK